MNLYLIGYRGSGKSTVAPLIAKQIDWKFSDSDDLIESQADLSIAEIFAKQGESEFRRLETEVISSLASRSHLVVSLGGGAPLLEINRNLMESSGKTIWLFAATDILWQRISADPTSTQRRPNLTDLGGRAEVEQLLASRNPVYEACADYTIDVGALTPEETAERIVTWWKSDDNNSGLPA